MSREGAIREEQSGDLQSFPKTFTTVRSPLTDLP